MTHIERSTVVGVFDDQAHAEKAIHELRNVGFDGDQIGIAVRSEARRGLDSDDLNPATEDTAATGIFTGGILGALAGAVATGLIPGLGPVLAAGLLGGILGGAAMGAAAGGLIGVLIGLGIPEDEAQYYQREFEAGRTIVTVRTEVRSADAFQILRRHGAHDVETRGYAPAGPPIAVS